MKEYNDYELLMMIRDGDQNAINLIYQKYTPIIVGFSKEYIHHVSHHGVEINDIMQEGYIGLEEAINAFSDSDDTSFYTFAVLCIKRKIINYLKKNKRDKLKFLNDAISLDEFVDRNTKDAFDMEFSFINKETEIELIMKLKETLTDLELNVFEYRTIGYSFAEIAKILNKDLKSIYNTFQRIKIKYKNLINVEY